MRDVEKNGNNSIWFHLIAPNIAVNCFCLGSVILHPNFNLGSIPGIPTEYLTRYLLNHQ